MLAAAQLCFPPVFCLQRAEAAMDVDAADASHAQQAPPAPALSDAVAQRALFSLQASTPASLISYA